MTNPCGSVESIQVQMSCGAFDCSRRSTLRAGHHSFVSQYITLPESDGGGERRRYKL